ncbi:hypothetical protein ASG88_04610 [Nocardioides sp. Soil777]|uniref:DUF4012 domain-containing protein n=1 Tax=Nocardioides sp. Soil777 TaxID=1736409 RepID=UPI000703592A|nr:DUF4012 domain-containing protein [Nocardioides sp. Soil777]KRF02658.1 hypothetical protein ASG88_04610 [Nocardioides sp. Soil777]
MPALSSFRKPVVLAAAAVGFAGLGVSLAQVPDAADSARAELESAKVALEDGDTDAATDAVHRAREHTDIVQVGVQGPAGLIGQWLPLVGTSVRDARHLGDALDAVVSVAELGAEAYPEITGDEATFFEGGRVDIPTLERLVATAGDAEDELSRARTSLTAIEATGPVGARLGDARDQALAQVDPLHDALSDLMPLMRELPDILGADGERKYLLAILNPAELLYSGGTALSYAPVTVSDGRVTIGETVDTDANTAMFQPRYWRKVQGNPFHRGPIRVALGGMAPSWPIAGEETLNAWRSLRGRNMSGLVAVDVIALARLSEITGPMEVPGYGRVDSTNLVETLIGSYDDYALADIAERKQANRALVPLFVERLLDAGQLPDKVRVLADAAAGRHFAVYFRDDEVQGTLDDLAISGDLSETKHDYLGVFTQNAVPSKTDYWQSRAVRCDVRLRPDGSARVTLEVEVHNDSAPYAGPGTDPQQGYFTRWSNLSVGSFLARGADVEVARVDGVPIDFTIGDYFGRPFVRHTIELPPQARRTVRLEYNVPAAAVRDGDSLTYRLDLDPQGMVRPQSVSVRVHLPNGFTADDLPEGWNANGRGTVTWTDETLDESSRLALVARHAER